MDNKLTSEKLNALSKEALVLMILSMQDQLTQLNSKMDSLMEQISVSNNYRFGRRTEKLDQVVGQVSFDFDEDGHMYFNEAEAINDACPDHEEPTIETVVRHRVPRPKGKKAADIRDMEIIELPVNDVSEEERISTFGSLDNCTRLPDELYHRLLYIPAGWKIEEAHVAVYRSRSGERKFLKGKTPTYLLRGSLVSPSLEAAIINAKYVNALPLRRIEKDFSMNGADLSEQDMASWTIKCADRYLQRLYDHLHGLLIPQHILQADETTVEVSKDGRKAGSKSYMWVYRTGQNITDKPIVLYDYQKTRNHEHPLEFLEGFKGILVCDGFPGYKTFSRKSGDITIAECWAHSRRKFTDALKAQKESARKGSVASDAIVMIAAITHANNKLAELSPEERLSERQKKVRPLVDEFFAWIHAKSSDKKLFLSDDTWEGINYCINQEEYLRTFLTDSEVPMTNNLTEGTIRGFTVGRKNWMMIDTVSGAKASAVIYSLVETAKANSLNPYYYFEHLLTELPKLKEFTSSEEEQEAMERLLPWSKDLPEQCHKRGR